MAIALQGTPTTAETTGASITCNVPAGAGAGELLVALLAAEQSTAVPTQAGWTRAGTSFEGTISVGLYYRAATNSEPGSYTFGDLPSARHSLIMARVSGADTTTLDAAAITFATGTASTTITAPSLTTVTDNAVIVYGIGVQSTSADRTLTPPTGVALAAKDPDAAAVGRRGFLFVSSQPLAGPTPTRTFTGTASLPMAGVGIALRQAAAVPTGPTAPTVNVGADVSIVSGQTVSRTATENDGGSDITDRAWTIIEGPVGAGQVIGTSATLSAQVTTTGTYRVRYTATNAVGSASDELILTVSATDTGGGGGTAIPPSFLHAINGRTTDTRFSAAVEASNATSVRLQVATDSAFTAGVVTGSAATMAVRGGIGYAHPTVSGLAPLTDYVYRLGLADTNGQVTWTGQVGSFTTGSLNPQNHRFVFGSCMNGSNSAATAAMATRGADLAFVTGDFWYRDGASQTVESFRGSARTQVRSADVRNLVRNVSNFGYTPDDHDAHTNDGTYSSTPTGWTNWNDMYREMFATGPLPTGRGSYEAFSWKGVRYILLDTRSFATPGTTVLGATQKAWFYNELDNCPDRAIVIVQGAVWASAAEAGEDGWQGTTAERNEVATRIKNSGTPAIILAGDMHALAANDGSTSPGNVPVFQAAPLYNSTSHKGGPYTAGPYPGTGVTAQQYGEIDVVFTDTTVTFAFTGRSAPTTARITESVTFASIAPAPVPEPEPDPGTGGGSGAGALSIGAEAVVGVSVGTTDVVGISVGDLDVWSQDGSTPTTPTEPTPVSSRGPSGSTVIWQWDPDRGLAVSGIWRHLQNAETTTSNQVIANWPNGTATRTTLPAGSSYDGIGKAVRFECRPGDVGGGAGNRSELSGALQSWVMQEGDERWIQYRFKVPVDFQITGPGYFIITQFHSGIGSPPVSISFDADRNLNVGGNAEGAPSKRLFNKAEFDAKRGQWIDLNLHLINSIDPAVGGVEVHLDGALVVPWHSRATMTSAENYVKIGMYRNTAVTSTNVVFFDDMRLTAP